MSKRTSDASKAIRKAWQQEQERVLEGKGTRDWTPEQQQAIIEKGKAYDSDGKAFHGHHMKSAEAYPEFQGDPDNIQFLSFSEHKSAHGAGETLRTAIMIISQDKLYHFLRKGILHVLLLI